MDPASIMHNLVEKMDPDDKLIMQPTIINKQQE
jgi:hypothetical protein